jgi:hypothetical protein
MDADDSTAPETLLAQIDAQQNDLLAELDALNARIERVLKECVLRDSPLKVVSDAA